MVKSGIIQVYSVMGNVNFDSDTLGKKKQSRVTDIPTNQEWNTQTMQENMSGLYPYSYCERLSQVTGCAWPQCNWKR